MTPREVMRVERGPSEEPNQLPWGPKLNAQQRMQLAKLSGAAGRIGVPEREALLAVSTDPLVWGVVLGAALRRVDIEPGSGYEQVVTLAREVGADEQAAQTHLEWLRHQPGL